MTANCTRFPCDTAQGRESHELGPDGTVVHRVSLTGDGGLDDGAWGVHVVAVDDGPWNVAVRVGLAGAGDWTVLPPDEGSGWKSEAKHMAETLVVASRFARDHSRRWAARTQSRGGEVA